MSLLLWIAPVFMVFEIAQLVLAERYLGIRQIVRGGDPRELGPSEALSLAWVLTWLLYGVWAFTLLFYAQARLPGILLGTVTGIGYGVRRNCGLSRILVVLTFEGAVRIGILGLLCRVWWLGG